MLGIMKFFSRVDLDISRVSENLHIHVLLFIHILSNGQYPDILGNDWAIVNRIFRYNYYHLVWSFGQACIYIFRH